jgi:hypothetical protein
MPSGADGQCPLWVISGHYLDLSQCPLLPPKAWAFAVAVASPTPMLLTSRSWRYALHSHRCRTRRSLVSNDYFRVLSTGLTPKCAHLALSGNEWRTREETRCCSAVRASNRLHICRWDVSTGMEMIWTRHCAPPPVLQARARTVSQPPVPKGFVMIFLCR